MPLTITLPTNPDDCVTPVPLYPPALSPCCPAPMIRNRLDIARADVIGYDPGGRYAVFPAVCALMSHACRFAVSSWMTNWPVAAVVALAASVSVVVPAPDEIVVMSQLASEATVCGVVGSQSGAAIVAPPMSLNVVPFVIPSSVNDPATRP